MNNTTLLFIIALFLLIGGLFVFSGTLAENTPDEISGGALTASSSFYDFGDVPLYGGLVTTEFELVNEGGEDVVVYSGTTSCGCTEAEINGVRFGMHTDMPRSVSIPAGGSMPLTVIYDPLAHGPSGVGEAVRSVFLTTNSEVTPNLEFRIRALVINN